MPGRAGSASTGGGSTGAGFPATDRRRSNARPKNATANAARMMNGRIESAGGTPRAAWSNRIWMYQRNGSSDPHDWAKSPMSWGSLLPLRWYIQILFDQAARGVPPRTRPSPS